MQSYTLSNLGSPLDVEITKSKVAQRIILKINNSGNVKLTLPFYIKYEIALEFLIDKELWLRNKLSQVNISSIKLEEDVIPIMGTNYKINYVISKATSVSISNNEITIYSKQYLHNKILVLYIKDHLLSQIKKLSEILANKWNFSYHHIKIVNSKVKWGSCSSKKILSFNWRLAFAPMDVIEYVVVHELCHLIEMNHSKKFWALVENIYPDFKLAKLWLKNNGRILHQYLTNDVNAF